MKKGMQFFFILLMSNFVFCADKSNLRSDVQKPKLPSISQVQNFDIHNDNKIIDNPVGQYFTNNSSHTLHNFQPKKNLSQGAIRIEPKPTKVKTPNQ